MTRRRLRTFGMPIAGVCFIGLAAVILDGVFDRDREIRVEFQAGDTPGWSRGNHRLGRGFVRPENVSVGNGGLRLRLPAQRTDGAELSSHESFRDGSFSARMKLPNVPGSLTGFFLYRPPDFQSEIDLELVNSPEGRVLHTVYNRGGERHSAKRLGFDPTQAFHDYGFERSPDGVQFLVDGRPVQAFGGRSPRAPMRLYVNVWWPKWLAGFPPRADSDLVVESIRHPVPGKME